MTFDSLARHYRWMEWVLAGKTLQRCRTAFLERVAGAQEALLAGEGNGRFLVECRRKLPAARITVVEASAAMIEAARAQLARGRLGLDRVQFVQGDALEWRANGRRFDLIATHFFLDCFPPDQLKGVIANLSRNAAPTAAWLLADFQIPGHGFRRWRARAIHGIMYRFFRAVTRLPARRLTPPDGFLMDERFALIERRVADWDLLHTDLWRRDSSKTAHWAWSEAPPA